MSAPTPEERLVAIEQAMEELEEQVREVTAALSDDRLFMTPNAAATRLGIDYPSMQRLIDEGAVPVIKIGERTLVTTAKVEAMLTD